MAEQSRALIYTPHGRDAVIAAALLKEAGSASFVCSDFASLEAAIGDDACFAVVTEEALTNSDLRGVTTWVAEQPEWSDFLFIILVWSGGGLERNPGAARLSDLLGNVSFLERPFHPTTFVSLARAARKGRNRQFEARARIEELHDSQARLSTALLAGRLGSWELDLETKALTASETCRALFGRSADAPFGYDDLVASVHPDDRPTMLAAVQSSISDNADYTIEHRTIWPDGSIHWAEARARLVRDRVGGRQRLVGVSSDITARRTAENDLRRMNETLEQRVAVRTAELRQAHDAVLLEAEQRRRAEELLRQSQKMEAVGQLTGGLAHDFNNLLGGITGNLELMERRISQGRTSELSRYVAAAQGAATRAAALTHRLLAFSRRQTLAPKPTAINQLVAEMKDLIVRTVGPGIEMTTIAADGLWTTLVDPNQLENALLNLCLNARDAMPEGGRLTIETANVELDSRAASELDLPAGSYASLCVTDTGTGMKTDVIERAFDPFFTTKPLGQGTGLGLSMVYGFVRQSGGQIRIRSEVERGTSMSLYLPRHDDLEVAATQFEGTDAPPLGKGETVLVVDDEVTVRLVVTEVLQDLGYKAVEAADGQSGLTVLQSGLRVDLLVTDVGLPGGMNGRQLADAARAIRPDLRILFITGYAEAAVIGDEHLEPGMQVLTKPFTVSALASRMKNLIDDGKARH